MIKRIKTIAYSAIAAITAILLAFESFMNVFAQNDTPKHKEN
jgi:hypothetical protein